MTKTEYEEVIKSIEVSVFEIGKSGLCVYLKGRMIDSYTGMEMGVIRNIPFIRCKVKGKKSKTTLVPQTYAGRVAFDSELGRTVNVNR